jgi:hypothetical protein
MADYERVLGRARDRQREIDDRYRRGEITRVERDRHWREINNYIDPGVEVAQQRLQEPAAVQPEVRAEAAPPEAQNPDAEMVGLPDGSLAKRRDLYALANLREDLETQLRANREAHYTLQDDTKSHMMQQCAQQFYNDVASGRLQIPGGSLGSGDVRMVQHAVHFSPDDFGLRMRVTFQVRKQPRLTRNYLTDTTTGGTADWIVNPYTNSTTDVTYTSNSISDHYLDLGTGATATDTTYNVGNTITWQPIRAYDTDRTGEWIYNRPMYGNRPFFPETPEQRQAREEQQAQYHAKRKAANTRAEELLRQYLNEEQTAQLEKYQAFYVVSQSGQLYRLRKKDHINVDHIDRKSGQVLQTLCVVPKTRVPVCDTLLSQKLMLEMNEAEFVKLANKHKPFVPVIPAEERLVLAA